MSYASLTIKREQDGHQVVPRPRVTDAIGHSLRGAFDDANGVPEDIARMLRQLDSIPHRLN